MYFTQLPPCRGHMSQNDTSDHAQILVSLNDSTVHVIHGILYSDQSARKPPTREAHLNMVWDYQTKSSIKNTKCSYLKVTQKYLQYHKNILEYLRKFYWPLLQQLYFLYYVTSETLKYKFSSVQECLLMWNNPVQLVHSRVVSVANFFFEKLT